MKRLYAVRAFGWQLDWRTDGWLPLGVRERRPGYFEGWHVLRLGRLGCVTLGRLSPPPPPITVTLTVDTSRFTEAMAKVGPLLRDAESESRYRHAVKVQRLLGLVHVYGELDDWLTDLGLSWEDLR